MATLYIDGERFEGEIGNFSVELNTPQVENTYGLIEFPQEEITFTFGVPLSEVSDDLLAEFMYFPNACPTCEYSHEKRLWIRNKEDIFCCANCGYILLEKDCYPAVIE